MNWTLPALWRDFTNAWSAENWPYTVAFWVIIGLVALAASARSKGEEDEPR